jgi:uncharacterized protein YutE (UPF0331/DUF86 family)
MVDKTILAGRLAAIRDALDRIENVLPATLEEYRADRTTREVVILNLFTALQDSIGLATHWLADAGWDVPKSYGEVFSALGEHGVLDQDLALRLRSAAGLRNLIAHQYGVLDFDRVFGIASSQRQDLLAFCKQLSTRAEAEES